jgi:hypothetical protein
MNECGNAIAKPQRQELTNAKILGAAYAKLVRGRICLPAHLLDNSSSPLRSFVPVLLSKNIGLQHFSDTLDRGYQRRVLGHKSAELLDVHRPLVTF